jgi:hypothetical protein
MLEAQPPKVFISYSWDDPGHCEWVRKFAIRLRQDGINAILDRWEAIPGDQLPKFMEQAVNESDFVLCICTANFKRKSDQRGGGVGYEGDIMTGAVFVSRNERKFIPILRSGEWEQSAPTWLLGKYYIDLRGEPYREDSYADLMRTLFNVREVAPPIGNGWMDVISPKIESHTVEQEIGLAVPDSPNGIISNFEFVNREIELATLNPIELHTSYWQCALISAPTGYGKTRLLNRLIEKIDGNDGLKLRWNYRYVNVANCEDSTNIISYIWESVCNRKLSSAFGIEEASKDLCHYILDNMSASSGNSPARGILLIFDSVEKLTSANMEWLWLVFHEVVTGSYIDYERDEVSFPVRLVLAGVDTKSLWESYERWEKSSNCKYFLRAPQELNLSAFGKVHVEELISRRAKKRGISVGQWIISDIAAKLLYISGGHPAAINGILDELFEVNLRRYDDYLKSNRERLIKKYISRVAQNILQHFQPQDQEDIKMICVFRLIDLKTLSTLFAEGLIISQENIRLLGLLCEHKILKPPSAEKLFYHDDIIRRMLYLDLAFRNNDDVERVQKTHECAKRLYYELINSNQDQHSLHYFFVEWLFHVLQIANFSENAVMLEWESMLAQTQPVSVSSDDLRRAIREKLETDVEIKYLYRERFGSEDFSPFFK